MSEIGELTKTLYDEFFKRDLLGKFGPGSMAILAVSVALNVGTHLSVNPNAVQWLIVVAAVPLAFVTGVSLQIVGELLGLHSASPRPRYIGFRPSKGKWKEVNDDYDKRLILIRNASEDKWRAGSKAQRERFIVLKETCGNNGLALLVVLGCLLARWSSDRLGATVVVAVLALLCLVSHFLHATRQARFEIGVLEQSNLLDKNYADAMRNRV